MIQLKQYSMVRIKNMLNTPEHYDGWKVNQRPPQIGDTGAIVEILKAKGLPDCYVVENVANNGSTIWLADFFAEELEVISDIED